MRSPAAAIGWGFLQRHRWGLIAIALYLAVLAGIRLLVSGLGQRAAIDPGFSFALAVVVPLSSIFFYFLAVFSFGLEGDLAARQSVYPARMFSLPVTNVALSGLPMLYGTVAIAVIWLPTRLLAVWPPEVQVPLVSRSQREGQDTFERPEGAGGVAGRVGVSPRAARTR